jgi:hypothetical protein
VTVSRLAIIDLGSAQANRFQLFGTVFACFIAILQPQWEVNCSPHLFGHLDFTYFTFG